MTYLKSVSQMRRFVKEVQIEKVFDMIEADARQSKYVSEIPESMMLPHVKDKLLEHGYSVDENYIGDNGEVRVFVVKFEEVKREVAGDIPF